MVTIIEFSLRRRELAIAHERRLIMKNRAKITWLLAGFLLFTLACRIPSQQTPTASATTTTTPSVPTLAPTSAPTPMLTPTSAPTLTLTPTSAPTPMLTPTSAPTTSSETAETTSEYTQIEIVYHNKRWGNPPPGRTGGWSVDVSLIGEHPPMSELTVTGGYVTKGLSYVTIWSDGADALAFGISYRGEPLEIIAWGQHMGTAIHIPSPE